jgi:hypothetical protein
VFGKNKGGIQSSAGHIFRRIISTCTLPRTVTPWRYLHRCAESAYASISAVQVQLINRIPNCTIPQPIPNKRHLRILEEGIGGVTELQEPGGGAI